MCWTENSFRVKQEVLLDEGVRNTFAHSLLSSIQELPNCTADFEEELV